MQRKTKSILPMKQRLPALMATGLVGMLIALACQKPAADSAFVPERRTVAATSGLRLREAPQADAKPVTLLKAGTVVHVLEEKPETVTIQGRSGRWVRISLTGNPAESAGWVFGGHLRAEGEADPADLANRLVVGVWRTPKLRKAPDGWYHELEFGKDGEVRNSCLGECGQFGEGTFEIQGDSINIKFNEGGSPDFKEGTCWIVPRPELDADFAEALKCEVPGGSVHGSGSIYYYNHKS